MFLTESPATLECFAAVPENFAERPENSQGRWTRFQKS
jgi:hypothetical protein